jgi:hypothetical protein
MVAATALSVPTSDRSLAEVVTSVRETMASPSAS